LGHVSPAPEDFDAAMAERWHTWKRHGHAQAVQTKSRAQALFALAGLAGVAAVVRHLLQA
jgi:hypothetical protein